MPTISTISFVIAYSSASTSSSTEIEAAFPSEEMTFPSSIRSPSTRALNVARSAASFGAFPSGAAIRTVIELSVPVITWELSGVMTSSTPRISANASAISSILRRVASLNTPFSFRIITNIPNERPYFASASSRSLMIGSSLLKNLRKSVSWVRCGIANDIPSATAATIAIVQNGRSTANLINRFI